jgi:hypothetical protein
VTGTLLIRRGQPCTATPTGLRLIRHHDEIALLETTLGADLPNLTQGPATLRIAVNADSHGSSRAGGNVRLSSTGDRRSDVRRTGSGAARSLPPSPRTSSASGL